MLDVPDSRINLLEHGKAYRLLVKFREQWLPLVWFKLSPDVSLYIGPSVKHSKPLGFKTAEVNKKGEISLPVTKEKTSGNETPSDHPHLSIHGSGVLNGGEARERIFPLREIEYPFL